MKIHPESSEHSIYLMQKLRIVNSDCLNFFDSGANPHLIGKFSKEGKVAEDFRKSFCTGSDQRLNYLYGVR